MQVQRIDSVTELERFRPVWNELADGNPFRRFEWMFNWWTANEFDRDLFVLVARDDDRQIVGIAPFYREQTLSGGRIVQFLGNGKACSEYQSLLVRPDNIERVSLAFARWLAAASAMREHGWDQCDLEAVLDGDAAINALSRQMEAFEVVISQKEDKPCWCLQLPGTWDEFQASLKKPVRRKLKTLARRYVQTQRAILRAADTQVEVDLFFDHLVRLHERRWKQVGVAGCFSYDGFERFLHGAVRELGSNGQLQFTQLEIDATVAAVSCAFTGKHGILVYQCGVDPEQKEHQPGWLLNMMVLRRLIESGARECDFLRGEERYKRELGARAKPQVQVRLAAPHTRGRLHHQLSITQDAIRNWGQQLATAIRG